MQVVADAGHDPEEPSWEASISGWVDGEGELRPEDLDSPYGRQVWDTYHLIGDVLRNPELAIRPSDLFYARVSKAVDAQPSIVAPRALRAHHPVRVGLSGLAIAAAVATVVWVALPYLAGPPAGAPEPVQVLATANDDPGLHDYLDAHREAAGVSAVRQVSFGQGASK
jgi:sigma-E factor negative regulatory protein RseA